MFDASNIDITKLGIEAACRQAYEAGKRDSGCLFCAGMEAGRRMALCGLSAAAEPVEAWFNGDYTVLLFADGQKEKVRWRREPGTEDDREKAVMACMLKHLVGNGYIAALRAFGSKPAAPAGTEPEALPPVCCEEEGDGIPPQPPVEVGEESGLPVQPPIDCDAAEDEDLRQELMAMDAEPGFGPELFRE